LAIAFEKNYEGNTMKKTAFFIISLLIILLLTGCHEHVWNEATCLEPKTCKKCGETEGETRSLQNLACKEMLALEQRLDGIRVLIACSDMLEGFAGLKKEKQHSKMVMEAANRLSTMLGYIS